MNLKELRELLQLLIDRGISEFEMERGSLKIRVKRDVRSEAASSPTVPETPVLAPTSPPAPSSSTSEGPSTPTPAPEVSAGAIPSADEVFIVKSPMVGTYYQAPNPNAPPFVNVGDTVEVGQVLCIVEAMKLMNEIESEVAGEILRIYGENGKPVEYGESLFAIKPSRKK